MATEEQAIVTTELENGGTMVHHRDFPEIRAEGENLAQAAEQLGHHLDRALDSALLDWRRDQITHAKADVKAFLATVKS